MQGILPWNREGIPTDVIAGVTLATLAIPEVMGYTSIAGMPVITGLYTILIPLLLFALLGSSRHLVVGADSATAAILAAGLAGLATAQSDQYVALAGMVALMAAALLVIARLVGLGFLADFMSRTVLIGFMTGVGIQVACGQVGGMLGLPKGSGVTINGRTFDNTLAKLWSTLENIADTSWTTVAVSAGVLVVILGGKAISPKIPGALVAVLGSMFISWQWNLASHGVATLGPVPGGLPSISFPSVPRSDIPELLATAVSIFVLILAQSAATSRAYAAKYSDKFDENVDLVGLGAANIGAAFTGTFVVNGSPTKTQMVDGAGGKSQLASLTTVGIVAIVLLWLTVPLQYMPEAVLSTVVFLIGIELIDIAGMKRVWRLRRDEFVVAAITAATVVLVGVLQGIIIAIVLSLIDHLRRSYRPPTAVMTRMSGAHAGDWSAGKVTPDVRTEPGLVVYRFSAPLYYANAEHFTEELLAFGTSDDPPEWVCVYAAAIPDVDMSGAESLKSILANLSANGVTLVFAEVMAEVREEFDRYELTELIGPEHIFPSVAAAEQAFRARSNV
ncbi:MAG TPA: SulP family inorganic anion transporter [Ilumatobacteraceae bacterium]|nr:SulP family inorganic anion transporter [Ilumatobacteraceae bacterium]